MGLNPDGDHVPRTTYHVSFRNKLLKYPQYFWLLFRHAKNADVIYAMGPVNAGLPALIAARLRRKRFVVKVVGDYAWEQFLVKFQISNIKSQINPKFQIPSIEEFQKMRFDTLTEIRRWIQCLVVKHADKVVVPSEYLKKIVIGWGANENMVEVIYNAVEFGEVDSIRHSGERWLVSVGRLVPWKGMGTLIEIMPDLLKQFPDLKLKIVGDGPQMGNYKLQITNYKLNDFVELTGELSREKTLSYIRSADIFVLNSGYEGLSHVILEALSFGRPVLASNVGGNPELLDKENLFAYDNKQELINKISLSLKNNVSQISNFELFKKFSMSNMVECTRNTLNNVTIEQ